MLKFMLKFFNACRNIALIGFGAFLGAVFEYGMVVELALGLVVCVFLYRLSTDQAIKIGEEVLSNAEEQASKEDDA
jgi:hypothetical protein